MMENYMLSEVCKIKTIHWTSFSSNKSLQNSKGHPLQCYLCISSDKNTLSIKANHMITMAVINV